MGSASILLRDSRERVKIAAAPDVCKSDFIYLDSAFTLEALDIDGFFLLYDDLKNHLIVSSQFVSLT